MGESNLTAELDSEPTLNGLAGEFARTLAAARAWPLVIGLRGDLGSGKTTWVRAMLRGLGYAGRVPSPTYTLLEQYTCGELSVVHLDLYRLRSGEELENLGLRDWLAERPDSLNFQHGKYPLGHLPTPRHWKLRLPQAAVSD